MTTSVTAAAPAWMDGVPVAGAPMRRHVLGAILPQAGIIRGLAVAALPTPDMRVRIPVGLSAVDDGQDGYYPVELTTETDLDIAASSATQGRYDSVIAEVVDTGDFATALYRYRVVTGTPAASPTPPSLPYADQPSALTLRVANVYVQPNAETSGNIRAQDVTVVAPSALIVPRPLQTTQAISLDNPSPVAGAWTDFTSGQWPAVTFTVPPSGEAHVTVGAECYNDHGTTSTTRVAWRASGGYTKAADFGVDVGGRTFATATRRYLLTGMTPGASVTITPVYRLSNVPDYGSGEAASVHHGNLIVEPVA